MAKLKRKSRYNQAILSFILKNVDKHSNDIATLTAGQFKVTRVTANRYLDRLVATGELMQIGETKARKYSLVDKRSESLDIPIAEGSQEHLLYREYIAPHLDGVPQNVLEAIEYGASEMINNVIDHSESKTMDIVIRRSAARIEIDIRDFGIGIFKKIVRDCKLNDEREAILELSKGKLTTDPAHHTGEGIFFTSRMCQRFTILSGELAFVHDNPDDDDYLIEAEDRGRSLRGTSVAMEVALDSTVSVQDIFGTYEEDEDGAKRFAKTHVPVRLALYPNEQLVSRSQARRVLARFNKFSEIMLDFKNVPMIGQAFADEIFRVFRSEHPEIKLIPIRMSKPVIETIARAVANGNGR
jgi:anti-sigma regulatory factor (Ser/Thr protein kinase)